MKDIRDLKVWEKAHRLTVDVYRVTKSFPTEERYGLTSQIRRACASIPVNIAAGCGRGGDRELARFGQIAMGSASEVEYHVFLARESDILTELAYERINHAVCEVKRMLASFIQKLKAEC